jgi:RNA polymerase sigma factor (sigma-70 family)
MTTDSVNALLEQLCKGDATAAERVFLTYEPHLRIVVRRMLPAHLHSKFDSIDIVQSVWADLVHGFRDAGWRFQNAAQLRAFLVKVTRNRSLNHIRRHGKAAGQQQPFEPSDLNHRAHAAGPRPSEVAQAEELWGQLLALCPVHHQELLRLKRDGYSLDEIAHSTGLHPSSVRRILYDLAGRLAVQLAASIPSAAPGGDKPRRS